MTQKTPLIFFGSSKLVLPIIAMLTNHFDLQLVITTEKHTTDAVPAYCSKQTIPYISVTQLDNKTIEQLEALHVPVAVLADFGLIVPQKVLELFPKGIINVHPSLLPKYRGPTPVQSAMIAGEKETGVSIIRLDEHVDHGPLLAQEKEPIIDTDTGETLHIRLFEKGARLLSQVLPAYLSEEITPLPQDDTKATFTQKLTRDSGYIDSHSGEIVRKIRAYYPWPGVWTKTVLKEKEVRIKLLPEERLQVEGKKPMSYKDFLNGYPEKREWLNTLLS